MTTKQLIEKLSSIQRYDLRSIGYGYGGDELYKESTGSLVYIDEVLAALGLEDICGENGWEIVERK